MKLSYYINNYNILVPRSSYELTCEYCGIITPKPTWLIKKRIAKGYVRSFCNTKCSGAYNKKVYIYTCAHCATEFNRFISNKDKRKNKSGNVFCNSSCAAKYNNTHKKHGTNRSKFEVWVQSKLNFPDAEYNNRSLLGLELDVYIPSINLAIEINGITHYKPIYGKDKYLKTIERDKRKIELCKEKGIALFVLDVSRMNRFTPESGQPYLDMILIRIEKALIRAGV